MCFALLYSVITKTARRVLGVDILMSQPRAVRLDWFAFMHQKGPTFLIAGAPRSGTTWLYHLLDRHPQIYMARPVRPEPKFFLVDELYDRGWQFYVDTWFADVAS